MIEDAERARLHAELDRIIERANAFEQSDGFSFDPRRSEIEARLVVRSALDLAAVASGRAAHARAIGDTDGAPAIRRVSQCLQLMSRFVDPNGTMKPPVSDLALELRAIAAGDAPRLLASKKRVRGRPVNAYRRLSFQLRAFEWDTLLAALRVQPGQRQAMIASAYGYPWDTIAKWKGACSAGLGDEAVDAALYFARVTSSQWLGADVEEIQARIDQDGAAYRAELDAAAGRLASSSE